MYMYMFDCISQLASWPHMQKEHLLLAQLVELYVSSSWSQLQIKLEQLTHMRKIANEGGSIENSSCLQCTSPTVQRLGWVWFWESESCSHVQH